MIDFKNIFFQRIQTTQRMKFQWSKFKIAHFPGSETEALLAVGKLIS